MWGGGPRPLQEIDQASICSGGSNTTRPLRQTAIEFPISLCSRKAARTAFCAASINRRCSPSLGPYFSSPETVTSVTEAVFLISLSSSRATCPHRAARPEPVFYGAPDQCVIDEVLVSCAADSWLKTRRESAPCVVTSPRRGARHCRGLAPCLAPISQVFPTILEYSHMHIGDRLLGCAGYPTNQRHRTLAVYEHVAEGDDLTMVSNSGDDLGIVLGEAFNGLADDLDIFARYAAGAGDLRGSRRVSCRVQHRG